jgi:hypothetical protein
MTPDYLIEVLDSELVIGLVGAVGTELKLVIGLLEERFNLAGYGVEVIKISSDVIPLLQTVPDTEDDEYRRISELMTAGNKAREIAKNDSVLALGVAAFIISRRPKNGAENPNPPTKTVYVVDSLKRPEEVEMLRQMYPSGFILIGVHSEENRRRCHLENNLGISQNDAIEL